MANVLAGLKPERLFHYFEELSNIPRGSGNEMACSNYVVEFAKAHGLRYRQDEFYNVVIWMDASPGCENAPTCMMQAHMDIVCEKNPGVDFDFEKQGLKLIVDGDLIKADGTTLGGDDGFGCSIMLAFLENPTEKHPPIECVFTVEEELGLFGAIKMDKSDLKSEYLFNMDASKLGKMQAGCAGALDYIYEQDVVFEDAGCHDAALTIGFGGLRGGHSGADIHEDRANSNKLMGRTLYELECAGVDYRVFAIEGGAKPNAIPRNAEVSIALPSAELGKAKEVITTFLTGIKNEIKINEPDFAYTLTEGKAPAKVFSKGDCEKICRIIMLAPNGTNTRSPYFENLAESSSNLGVICLINDGKTIKYNNKIRCNVTSLKTDLTRRCKLLGELMGVKGYEYADIPVWEYDADRFIVKEIQKTYKELFGTELQLETSHGSCECGIFSEGVPGGMEAVSMGTDIWDLHSPDERMSISSFAKFDQLIRALMTKFAGFTKKK